MSVKAFFSKPLASWVSHNIIRQTKDPIKYQNQIFRMILKKASDTWYGREYGFSSVKSYDIYRKQVPIIDYEIIQPLIERISSGEKNILWPGLPIYFAKTSGTTSGVKYITYHKRIDAKSHQFRTQCTTNVYFQDR